MLGKFNLIIINTEEDSRSDEDELRYNNPRAGVDPSNKLLANVVVMRPIKVKRSEN